MNSDKRSHPISRPLFQSCGLTPRAFTFQLSSVPLARRSVVETCPPGGSVRHFGPTLAAHTFGLHCRPTPRKQTRSAAVGFEMSALKLRLGAPPNHAIFLQKTVLARAGLGASGVRWLRGSHWSVEASQSLNLSLVQCAGKPVSGFHVGAVHGGRG